MFDLIAVLAAVFFLFLNAFFVLSEFAIVKVRATRLNELASGGNTAAAIAKEQVAHLEAYLSTAQLGITIASLGLGWVGEPAIAHLIRPVFEYFNAPFSDAFSRSAALASAFIFITGAHVVIGELVPKNMAIRLPETSALLVAVPFKIFHTVMFVPMWLLNEAANLFLRLLRIKPSESEMLHSEEELRMILGQSQEHGRLSLGRLMMFEHLFDFGKTGVTEVMTPLRSIAYISLHRTWAENIAVIKEKKFSRYPLTTGDLGKADSFIHFKDLALDLLDRSGACFTPELQKLKRPLHFIQESITVERALRDFQEKRIHFALVKNPQGEISGLLTMEDIVEELTGEIRDEFEVPPTLTLSQALVGAAFVPDLKEGARPEAIRELLERLRSIHPVFDLEETFKAIMRRESNFSTALGHQTAFPHARLQGLPRTMVAVGMRRDGIDFPSADNQPVRIIFLILTPFNEPTAQLHILSSLSGLISNLTLRRRLFSAKTPANLIDIIRTFENKVMK